MDTHENDVAVSFIGIIAIAIIIFCGIVFLWYNCAGAQTIGETQVGIAEINVSLDRSREDTVIVVGSQVEFIFPEGSQRIATLWREWPWIGHIAEKDVLITDDGIVLPVYPMYNQIVSFAVWYDDYLFPAKSRKYFLVVLVMPPLLDVNEDGSVNMLDREQLKSLLGTRSAHRRYDPRCDFNNDGWIDRLDWLVFEQGKYL